MSWDAHFSARADGHLVSVGDWNYTHNTSGMIYKVLDTVGWERPLRENGHPSAWWDLLNGMSGAEGAKYLGVILGGLLEAPALFRQMNPENGWGDYDSLCETLEEMRATSERYPSGEWGADG